MPRATNNPAAKARRKKYLKSAKGFVGGKGSQYRQARETVDRALAFAYRDRRNKKREFRRLWITRINAAARLNGMSYNRFISGLKKADVDINRKMLAETEMDGTLGSTDATARLAEEYAAGCWQCPVYGHAGRARERSSTPRRGRPPGRPTAGRFAPRP